jgi:hypothetical protein
LPRARSIRHSIASREKDGSRRNGARPAGRKQLAAEEENWQRIADAVARVLSQA